MLDASVVLSWYMPDEEAAEAAFNRLREDTAMVPPGWLAEVANGLLNGERRRRLPSTDTAKALVDLEALPIRVVPQGSASTWLQVLDLAREHGLTAYDATYLELAIRERAALATLDDDLRVAAGRVGVRLVATA